MPKFMIERNVEGVGKLSDADFKDAAKKSCDVIREMGPEVQWVESYVTDDKFYCVYLAPDEHALRDHAARAGFPADAVNKVARMVDPVTAEA